MNPQEDPAPGVAYQMLYDFFYRVARWPDDTDISAIHAGFRALRRMMEQNEILERDLKEANLMLASEQKARRKDIIKIDALQQKIKQLRREGKL